VTGVTPLSLYSLLIKYPPTIVNKRKRKEKNKKLSKSIVFNSDMMVSFGLVMEYDKSEIFYFSRI